MRGRVYHIQFPLALASAVILGFETILYSLRFEASLFRLLRLAGSRWRYSTTPPHGKLSNQSQESVRARFALRLVLYRHQFVLSPSPLILTARIHSRIPVQWGSWPYFNVTLESNISHPFINSKRTECRSPSQTVSLLFSVYPLLQNIC
jgi:hypothetical protein